MEKKISFREWIAIVFGGVWQFVKNIFSWKSKTPFWRVIWAIITICIVCVTGMIAYIFVRDIVSHSSWNYDVRYDPYVSKAYKFRNNGYENGTSFIYNVHTKKKILKGIDWIAQPLDGDSLIVVAKDGKRGYWNRLTGKMSIPLKYDAAWIFSDGAAAVCEGDSVYFIDHSGKPINGKKYARDWGYNGYAYHGEYAAIPVDGRFGLVNRKGEWVYSPEYSEIEIAPKNVWYAEKDGKKGVIGGDGKFIVPLEYYHVHIYPESGIVVGMADHSQKRLDYGGNVVDEFVFDEIYCISYYTDEYDEDLNRKEKEAEMLKYSVDNYYGLMTKGGVPVTPPLYSGIEALGPNLYQCHIPGTYKSVIVKVGI